MLYPANPAQGGMISSGLGRMWVAPKGGGPRGLSLEGAPRGNPGVQPRGCCPDGNLGSAAQGTGILLSLSAQVG